MTVADDNPLGEEHLVKAANEDDEEDEEDETNRLSATSTSRDEVEEIKKIIKDETKIVRTWRWVVIFAMLLVGGVVTTATYIFLSNQEEDDFENAVRSSREKHSLFAFV